MSNYSYNKNFFEKIDSEVKAYWLGFLYADGCITRFYRGEKLKSMSLELTLKKEDNGHLFRFLNDIDSNIPVKDKKVGEYLCSRVVINCTKMCRDLIRLGCVPQKSLILEFPSNEILPSEYVKDFIRGYFDGDGCVYFNQTKVFHKNKNKEYLQKHFSVSLVGTFKMLKSIEKILSDNDINPNQKYIKTGNADQMYIYGVNNIRKFYNYIYNNSTVYLKRKKEKFQYAFSKYKLSS
jgi:LAGLIDADG-like domain